MSDIINQNTEPLFIFDMPDDEVLSQTISVQGEKGERGDPTKTSQLENDSDFVPSSELAAVATSGSYNDLTNKPTIDSEVSESSTNAVQNKVIYEEGTKRLHKYYPSRATSMDTEATGKGGMFVFQSTTSMEGYKPNNRDGKVIQLEWDNTSGFDTQLYVTHNGRPQLWARQMNEGEWGDWHLLSNSTMAQEPIASPDDDTTENWANIGDCTCWYDSAGQLIDQPSQYGFLINYMYSSDVFQIWKAQGEGGLYYRSGNYRGWLKSWTKLLDIESVDTALNATSTNPVQNRAIVAALSDKANISDIEDNYATKTELNTEVTEMDEEVSRLDGSISQLSTRVSSLASGSPLVANSISGMTDTTRVYVNTSDGNWYYYDGNGWVIGGVYQSDVDYDELVDKIESMTTVGDNLLNPWTCQDNTALSSQTGGIIPNNTNFWITDYIEINASQYWVAQPKLRWENPSSTGYGYYKVCYYDENKTFISVDTQSKKRITDVPSGAVYMILQFQKSQIAFEDRFTVYALAGDVFPNKAKIVSYLHIGEENIGAQAVGNNKLKMPASQGVKASCMRNGIVPFDTTDFSNVTIQSSTGELIYGETMWLRLSTPELFFVPAGTVFEMSGYQGLALEYDKNGNYKGRYTSDWSYTVTVTTDTYIRMTFRKEDNSAMTDSDAGALIAGMTVRWSDPDTVSATYDGEKISLLNTYKYKSAGIPTKHQDGAEYNGKVFEFNSTGYYDVYDMGGTALAKNLELDSRATIAPHANSVCFGTEKYNSSDTFPLIYINAYNNTALPKGTCYVYRMADDYTTTLLQTIRIGFTDSELWISSSSDSRPYGNFVVDTDNNYLYVFTLRDADHKTRFFKFNLPTLSQGSTVTLSESDIIEYWDLDFFPYIQGVAYYAGKLYSTNGNNNIVANSSALRVIDLTSKSQTSYLNLSTLCSEPETVFIKDGKLYVGQTALFELTF